MSYFGKYEYNLSLYLVVIYKSQDINLHIYTLSISDLGIPIFSVLVSLSFVSFDY